MKKIFSLFTFSLLATAVLAQKTINDPNAELRTVGSFHGVQVSGGIDLYLSSGGEEAVAVSAKNEASRSRIKTEIKNGILMIGFEYKEGGDRSLNWNTQGKAYVSFKMLDYLGASGGSTILLDGTITGDKLSIDISGGSDFTGKVDVNMLKTDQSGGSDLNISGAAKTLAVSASGGSDFDGFDLVTDICDISASGGSDISITVNKELSADTSGASDVNWKGKAVVKKAKASGAGSISHES